MPIGLVVHGGAGDIEPHEHAERLQACRAAVEAAREPLRQGCSALDAVEIAVRSLEAHPLLNAGYGAIVNRDGVVELDAMIMDGRTHAIGAVAALQRVIHPISLARYVMERTAHHFLVSAGAEHFAAEQGFPLVQPSALHRYKDTTKSGGDTVGAVALDSAGNVAVAVSTGGIEDKLPGRVGDSPIAGAGGYAENDSGAACATGIGEAIMRSLLTFRAVQALERGRHAQQAADQALSIFAQRFDGSGGLILIDKHGEIGIAHNTAYLPVAFIRGDQIVARISGQGVGG